MISIKNILLATVASTVVSAPVSAHEFTGVDIKMDREIAMCVAEVGKRANYDDAKRVLHQVMAVNQKNLAEQEIRIDTLVYAANDQVTSRQYASTCVTRGPLKIVKFRIVESASPALSAAN